MIFYFSFLALFAVTALVVPSRGQAQAFLGKAVLLLAAAAMGAFGVGLKKFCGMLGEGEQTVILEFLKRTLEANEEA